MIAIGSYGKPRVIRTDNESCFTSRLFNTVLAALGIRHQTTELACPWQNGRIERLFWTLKQTLDKFRIMSRTDLQDMLNAFSLWYNVVRPHQNLGGQTPLEGELAGYYPAVAPCPAAIQPSVKMTKTAKAQGVRMCRG